MITKILIILLLSCACVNSWAQEGTIEFENGSSGFSLAETTIFGSKYHCHIHGDISEDDTISFWWKEKVKRYCAYCFFEFLDRSIGEVEKIKH